MLEVAQLECVRGERVLFSAMNFSLARGQLLRVGGANGSGKTSLLRILCGLLTPAAGEVRWAAQPIARLREEYHRKLVYIGHQNGLKDELTPVENLAIALALAGIGADAHAVLAALEYFGIAAYADRPLRTLSQGQRRRVALARLVLAEQVPLWILDEPFTALDAKAVIRLQNLIQDHVGSGGIVVLTTHLEVVFAALEVVLINLDLLAGRA